MKNEKILNQQRKRLKSVIDYLKANGTMQKTICIQTDITETALCSYKNGKIKYIPNEFLENLHERYGINPDYIRLKSKEMLDDKGEKYSHFEKVVDSWETATKRADNGEEKKYLYLKMDKNFYDFLIEYDTYRKAEDEGIPIGKIKELKAMYEGTPDIHEFVVLPKNTLFDIVSDTVEKDKKIEKLINFSEHKLILKKD